LNYTGQTNNETTKDGKSALKQDERKKSSGKKQITIKGDWQEKGLPPKKTKRGGNRPGWEKESSSRLLGTQEKPVKLQKSRWAGPFRIREIRKGGKWGRGKGLWAVGCGQNLEEERTCMALGENSTSGEKRVRSSRRKSQGIVNLGFQL